MSKISVVVPVYNVEKYLDQCIESILSQEFNDYEVILVNDGSKDSSGCICERYSEKYDFIHTLHKENGGLSDARNVGLQHARGEYILFIDSDDYIFENSLTAINENIEENPDVDVVFLEAVKVFTDGSTIPLKDGYQKEAIFKKSHEAVLAHVATLPKFPGSACTKLVKQSLIYKNQIYFQEGQLSEDIDWTVRLLLTAQTFNYCQNDYYYYRQNREGSITNTSNVKNVYSLLYIIKKWSRKIPDCPPISEFQKYINAFMAYEYIMVLVLYGNLSPSEKEKLREEIKSYSWLLTASKGKKVKTIKLIYYIFGLELVATILAYYQRLRKK